MKNKAHLEFLVGLFALAGFAVIIYLSATVNRLPVSRGEGNEYFGYFDTVSGLLPKTPVEFSGVNVGYVSGIGLENNKAKVTLRIDGKVALHRDASLRIKDRGILGDKVLVLDAGSDGTPLLPPGVQILSTSGRSDFDRLVNTMADASQDIKSITASLKKVMRTEDDEENLTSILRNFREVSENLKRTTDAVEKLTLANRGKINDVIADLKEISGSIREAVTDEQTGVKESLKKVNDALGRLSRVMEKIDKGEGSIGKLVNDETTVNNINNAVEGVNEFLASMRRIQTSFLYRGEYLWNSREMQNLVALYIQTRPDKFFLVEIVDSPFGKTSVTDTTVLGPNGQLLAQTKTVRTNDNLLYSLQFGKRFYDFTLRFGIIRSEGGVGLDYQFLNDIFKISVEGFNFDRYDNRPQLRLMGTVQLYKNFLVAAGFNDLIDRHKKRDFFVGGGVFFTDNDLKNIVASVPVPKL